MNKEYARWTSSAEERIENGRNNLTYLPCNFVEYWSTPYWYNTRMFFIPYWSMRIDGTPP